MKNYVDRLRFQENKRIVMLYMGDHDPTGLSILPAIEETLYNYFGLVNVECKRVALSRE